MTNCAKHARARQISIHLLDRDQQIELIIADDGIGFDRGKATHAGLGLVGIEERVRELGGAIGCTIGAGSRHDHSDSHSAEWEGGMSEIRVLLADDHGLLRKGVRSVLAEDAAYCRRR